MTFLLKIVYHIIEGVIMKEVWTKNLKKALIWLSGYLTFVAYAIVGGYTIVKSEDEDLKKEAKKAFIVTLILTAISAFFVIFDQFGGMSSNWYGSGAQKFSNICSRIVSIAKIVVYAIFLLIALFSGKEKAKDEPKVEVVENETEDKE